MQTALNQAAGLGIKAQKAKLNTDKVEGILNRLASEDSFDSVAWILQAPVVTFSMAVVDDSVRENAEFQAKAGLETKLIRTVRGKGCVWCRALAGTYEYDTAPKDVYRRHDNCRCTVEVVGSRGRDVVHSGTEGKRRYVRDKYGSYEMTAEAKAEQRRAREATAAERAKAAREKRISTWAKKKQDGWTAEAESVKIDKTAAQTKEQRIESLLKLKNGSTVSVPAKQIDTDSLTFDAEHVARHGVTREEAIQWIKDAKFSATVWNGEYTRFVAEQGATYVNNHGNYIRTAFSRKEFTEDIKKALEVFNDEGN